MLRSESASDRIWPTSSESSLGETLLVQSVAKGKVISQVTVSFTYIPHCKINDATARAKQIYESSN